MELFYVISRTVFVGNLRKRSVFPYFRTFLNFFGQNEWHICFSQPILRYFPKSDFGHRSTPLNWQAILPHIYRQGGGGFVDTPPKNFETANNYHMPFGTQLVHDLLINLHTNNHHLISCCCHGNKTKIQDGRRWPPSWIFDF